MSRTDESNGDCGVVSEAEVDAALEGSFPASDPPPWTLGVDPPCDAQKESGEPGPEEDKKR